MLVDKKSPKHPSNVTTNIIGGHAVVALKSQCQGQSCWVPQDRNRGEAQRNFHSLLSLCWSTRRAAQRKGRASDLAGGQACWAAFVSWGQSGLSRKDGKTWLFEKGRLAEIYTSGSNDFFFQLSILVTVGPSAVGKSK